MNPPDTGARGAANNLADNTAAAMSSAVGSAQDAASSLTQRNTGSSTSTSSDTTSKPASGGGGNDWAFASRDKGSSPLGSILFVTLRAADVYLQYALVRYDILPRAISYLPIGGHVIPHLSTPSTSILGLGLTPYHTLLTTFAFTAALKQIIWQLFISEQKMPATFALIVASFNTFFNTVNTLLSLHSWSSPSSGASALPIGTALFFVGISVELVSEIQRKIFKADKKNKGKPYGGGLWAYATNINYGGYTLWRAGYACVAGRLGWGGLVGAFVGSDFMKRAIPSMDRYCEGRYGRDWVRIRDRTKWKLIPGVC